MADPWKVLGVTVGTPKDELKRAYRAKIREHHPDVGGDPALFKQVKQAYGEAMKRLRSLGQDGLKGVEGGGTNVPAHVELADFLRWRSELDTDDGGGDDPRDWRRAPDAQQVQEEAWRRRAKAEARGHERLRPEPHPPIPEKPRGEGMKWDWAEWTTQKPTRDERWWANGVDADQARAPKAVSDRVVSTRVVRTARGPAKVPVYEDVSMNGARYYVSPISSKRVYVPA